MKRRPLAAVREETGVRWSGPDPDWAVCVLVACVGALCYANSLHGEFVHDDIPAVVANKDVTGENALYRVLLNDFWGTPMSDPASHKSYRPLTTLSFRLNYWACGLSPWWWHVCNAALHAACCALVARAAARVARLRRPFAALAALLFAVHPVHTEAVAGVVGRADVLACVFYLSSILVYHGCGEGSGGRRVWRGCALAALGVLAKETGLAALLANAAIDLHRSWAAANRSGSRWSWSRRGVAARLSRLTVALALVAGARLLLLQGALPTFSPQDNPPAFHPHSLVRCAPVIGILIVENQAAGFPMVMTFWYLAAFNWWLMLCPWALSHDWQMGSVPLVTSPADPRNLLTGAALLALAALAYRCIADFEVMRHTPAVVGLVLLVAPYLPASNLFVTVGFVIAERVLYIPSVGSVIITVYGVQLMYERGGRGARCGLLAAVALLALAGAARTHLRNRDWRTRESLLRADLAVLPHNAKLHYNFANYLKDTDQHENAIRHYREALRLWPSYASAHNNLGTLVGAPLAEHHFLQALRYNSRHVNAHYNLGKLYRKKNLISESSRMLERCVELAPRFVPARLEMLWLLPHAQRRPLLQQLLTLDPQSWEHWILYGNWLRDTGYKLEALKYYLEAMRLAFKSKTSSERSSSGDLAALRMACLILRELGQAARTLQLITRWQTVRWGARAHNLYLREWRRRAELAGRAQIYSRASAHMSSTTCFHHTQLEVPLSRSAFKQEDGQSRSGVLSRNRLTHVETNIEVVSKFTSNDCKSTKEVLSIPMLHKLMHNKSETGHKQNIPSVHDAKKENRIKEPDKVIGPYIPEHLSRTF